MKNIAILAFTKRGKELSNNLKRLLEQEDNVEIYSDKIKAKDFVKENFDKKDLFVFIGAAAIAVRLIAPYIKTKDVDPAVIVIDEFGQYVIPILSGHLGGANEAATNISEKIGATPIITTATDVNGMFAVDVWSKYVGCKIINVADIKKVSSAILSGEKVGIVSGFPFEGKMPEELTVDKTKIGICVSLSEKPKPFEETFNVVPKCITIGVGCRKDTSWKSFEKFVLASLEENNVSIEAVEKIASIDLKKFEKCILKFSEKYHIPFITNTADELVHVQGAFKPSEFVKSVTGVDNICERSAVLNSNNGTIILSKQSQNGMTIGMAKKDWKCKF